MLHAVVVVVVLLVCVCVCVRRPPANGGGPGLRAWDVPWGRAAAKGASRGAGGLGWGGGRKGASRGAEGERGGQRMRMRGGSGSSVPVHATWG